MTKNTNYKVPPYAAFSVFTLILSSKSKSFLQICFHNTTYISPWSLRVTTDNSKMKITHGKHDHKGLLLIYSVSYVFSIMNDKTIKQNVLFYLVEGYILNFMHNFCLENSDSVMCNIKKFQYKPFYIMYALG